MNDMMTPEQRHHTLRVLKEIESERIEQHLKWGEQNHPSFHPYELQNITPDDALAMANEARARCQEAFAQGRGSYSHIFCEEMGEALGEMHDESEQLLRNELVQVAAVAVAWIEAIDRRRNNAPDQ